MAGKGKYGTVMVDGTPWNRGFTKGKSNLATMEAAFAASPQLDGTYSLAKLVEVANKELAPTTAAQQGDIKIFEKGVDLNFQGRFGTTEISPPSYKDVKLKVDGQIKDALSSPFTPNIASPGPGEGGAINVRPNENPVNATDAVPNYAVKEGVTIDPVAALNEKLKKAGGVKIGSTMSLGTSGAPSRGVV